jgi:hypothetical protein
MEVQFLVGVMGTLTVVAILFWAVRSKSNSSGKVSPADETSNWERAKKQTHIRADDESQFWGRS